MASHRNTVTSVYDPTGKKKKKKKKEPTKSHRAEERREGAKKARENPVNKARTGAASYIVHDKVGSVASKPTKVISSTLKNSQDRAGMGRGRRSGAIQPTKNTGKLTSKQEERKKQSAKNENERNAQIAKNREDHRKNGYAYGNNAIKKLDETSKKIDKSFENKKKADLEYGASGLSDKKKDIPIYTKYVKGKAVNEAKTALDESGVTVKKARSATAEQIAKQEAEWKSAGYDVKDDTVVTEDGKTWGELKRSAYEEAENNVKKARKDYINKATKDAGKLSAQDIYKGGVEMASEMLDYAVPYAGTAKASIGVVKSATKAAKAAKAAKAVSKGAKKVSTGDAIKGVEKLLKDGKITPEVAKRLNRRIKLKALGKNVSTELAANALQDATIGTALDLGKGIGQGLEGKELGKYMRDNAIANIAMGAPMSAVAGRAGARETRDAIANNVAKQVNDLTNLTKPEAIKLGGLMKKQERGAITEAEEQTLRTLQDKALGNGTAVVDSKGKIEANKSEYALDDLDKSEIAEYYKLKVQDTRGSLDPRDRGRFEALQSKVQTAYKRSEINANDAINIKGKNIKSEDQGRMESAVKFFERTGDEAKLKQAQKSLELAKKATEKKNESLQNAIDTMTEKTGISYRFVDDAEMRNLVGGEIGEDEFAKGFYRVDKDGNAQVIINKESPQAHQTVIGHETAHLIKSNDEKAFNELGDLLKTYATEKGEFDALESQMKRAYPELGKDDFDEEVVSELLGRYVFGEDDKFIKRLADEQPTVLQRIAEYIRNFIAKTNNKELVEQLTKIQNKTDEVIRGMKTTDSEPRATESKASKEKITPESITDSSGKITREADWDYGQAVKNGDMETAQKMVDAALESKGFTYDAYHGSDSFGFTEFDFGKLDDNISIFASNSTETAGTYTKNPNVREVSDATMAREIDEDAINDLEDILWYSNNEPFKDAFDDWRADIDNGLEDARLEDYIEDAMDGAESMFGYMGKDDVIPDETIIEIQRLARKIDSSIKEDGGIYHGKVKMENPLVVEANGSNWQSIEEWMFKKSDKSVEARQKLDELDSEYDDYVWGVLTKDEEVKERLRSIAQKIQDEKPVKASSIKEYNDAYDAAVKEKYESGELIPKYKFADSGKSSVAKSQSEVARWLDDSEKKGFTYYTTREVAEYANENGHDGVIFKNLYDTGRYGTGLEDASDVYVVFNSEQFKSADPVTLDNSGNIIPLSERGNEKSPDLRFSKERGEKTYDISSPKGAPAAKALDKSGATLEAKGEPVAQFDKDGSTKFSLSSYDEFGRKELDKYLKSLVKRGEMSGDDAKGITSEVEKIYEICKKYADSGDYLPFSRWSNAEVVVDESGRPVFSSVKKNSEYKMNIDFSTVCKKRRTLDAVFDEMVSRGIIDRMNIGTLDSAKLVVEINNVIRKHGFEAACEVCFVEARRYRQQNTAKAFADLYNKLVESMYPDKSKISYFNFGGDKTINEVPDGIHSMDNSQLDLSYVKKVAKQGNSVEAKAARLLLKDPSQRKLVRTGDMMATTGFENMQVKNPSLMKLYNSKKGTGGAKSSFGDVQYLNEIIKSRTFNRDAAYAVGGVRVQSFSDYVPRMVFDYVQMVGDLAAKRLPMHAYTKEELFAKQFGLTGIKINLSLVPDYAADGVAAGLDKSGNYLWNANGTFPFDEAVRLQNAEGYKENCGTIAIGVSDKHIEKMLNDPDIQMIIPYHKSSLNPVIADMTNVDKFTNYEAVQETKVARGSTKTVKEDFPFNEELYKLSHGKDGKLKPKEDWGDARELANRYLSWCDERGYQPKFPQFRDNPNYYKLLEDFGLYDKDGNFKPQHDVQTKFPTDGDEFGSMSDLIKRGLDEDAVLEGKRTKDISSIVDEVTEKAKASGWLPDSGTAKTKLSKEKKQTGEPKKQTESGEPPAENEPWKLSNETKTKIKNTRSTVDNETRRLEIVEKKLNGKLGKKKRGELEAEKKDLEERIQRHKDQIRELNKPVYEHRIEVAEGKIKELQKKLEGASEEEKTHINNQIRGQRATITRNTNAMNGVERSDNVVSDTPVSALSDSELRKEYNVLGFVYRRGKTPEHQDLRLARMDELRAEAESRGLDIRKRQERIDELIKNKGVGYEEATKLNDEIKALREKVKAQNKKAKAGGKDAEKNYAQLSKLKKELVAKNRRMTQVLKNSKTTVKEGESFSEAFANKVGGNSLKVNKQSKFDVMKENYSDDKGFVHGAITSVRRLGENSLVAFENESKRLIKAGDDFGNEMLAQVNNVTVSRNIAASWIQTSRSSADGTKLGKSLDDVFKVKIDGKEVDLLKAENAKLRNGFSNYLYCRHAIDRERQSKTVFGNYDADGNPLWTSADARGYMDEIEEKYPAVKEFADEIDKYIKDLNQYRLDTGLISKELLDKMNDIYPNYVPTHRVSVKGREPVYELPRTVAQIDNVIKQATGSDKAIEDLYKQLAKITSETIRSGEQNKLVEMYAKSKGFEMKDIPEGATADEIMEASIVPVSDSDGKWRLSFFKDGKRVEIPIDKQAAKGLREWNGQDFKSLMEFSAKTQKLMRGYKGLITDWNLVFGVRNGMRDAQQALVNSKDSRWFAKSAPLALHAIAHEDNAFRKLYDARGGRWSTLQQISRLDDITNLNKGKSAIAKGLEKIEDINGFIEMNPRMSEFIGTLSKEADRLLEKKGGIAKLRESCKNNDEFAEKVVNLIQKENPKIIATAMRNASDITVNFARSGVIGKALNAGFVPYLNPSIQGLSKMARMFSESKTAGMKTLFGFMAKLSLLTTTPAVMNEVLCQGNEAYQSLNTRDKDSNFFIPMSLFGGDKDKFIKIPKPRENAVLVEPAEYAVRYLIDSAQYGTKDEFVQLFKSAQDNVGIVNIWQDNIFAPIVNTARNRTWYDGKILSKPELENIENGEAWKNYDETTSWFGKTIGKQFNVSPKKVDNIMDSYLGMIYDLGISQTSQRAQNDTFSSWSNFAKHNPVVQQFMKDSVYSNKLATKFWDEAGRLNKGKEGERNTLEYNEFCAKYANDSYTYDDAINALEFDKSIPKDKKYEIKRELRKKKNELMRSALDGDDIKDPMQQIINVYKNAGIKNATDKCLSEYSYGNYKEAYEHLKSTKEYRNASPKEKRELQGMYLKTYKGIKKISRQTGDTSIDYTTATYVCVKNGYTGGVLANAFCTKAKEYSVEKMMSRAQNYIDAGYDDKHFVKTFRAINRGAYKLNDEDKQFAGQLDDYDRAMILAQNKMDDGSYYIASGYLEERKNAARCLTDGHSNKDFKWTDKRVNNFCKEYNLKCDPKTYEWDEEQVKDAIDKKYPNKTTEEKAALFVVITGLDHNPYGKIGDYSLDGDSGISDGGSGNGKGGRGRRGRRGGRGGGGGGSKSGGTPPKTASGAFKGKATSPFSTSNGTKKSNLDDAYRKKAMKLREANRRILS